MAGNPPDARTLLHLGGALIEQYYASFRHVPKRFVLEIDDTFEGRFVTAMLWPGKRPGGARYPRAPLRATW